MAAKSKKKQSKGISVRLKEDEHVLIQAYSLETGTSLLEAIRRAVDNIIERRQMVVGGAKKVTNKGASNE